MVLFPLAMLPVKPIMSVMILPSPFIAFDKSDKHECHGRQFSFSQLGCRNFYMLRLLGRRQIIPAETFPFHPGHSHMSVLSFLLEQQPLPGLRSLVVESLLLLSSLIYLLFLTDEHQL